MAPEPHCGLGTLLNELDLEKNWIYSTITLCALISSYLLHQVPLADYPHHMFGSDPMRVTIEAFHEDLQRLSEMIKARNSKLEIPYTYLLPESITNSVSM